MYSCSTEPRGYSFARSIWRGNFLLLLLLVSLPATPGVEQFLFAQEPSSKKTSSTNSIRLRDLIDSHFQKDLPRSLIASDAEFARRVSIDLTGMPLGVDRLKEFLKNQDENKREKLVDELVASVHFERRLATFIDVTLMERRAYRDIKENQWMDFLLKSVRDNKPWNVLAREILVADGIDDTLRPAVRFALARDAEPNLLTRDIGRIFFGRDLQCAQCHDHPLVEDYLQSDYQGLMAFIAPGYIKTIQKPGPKTKDGKPGKNVATKIYAEKDGNDINFESVFIKNTKHRTGPRLIGEKSIIEPDAFPVSTSSANRPTQSRRQVLADQTTDGSNQAFNENMANRLWGMMLGRGLVHPPDFHHRDNPPVKPALLKQLGQKFAEMKFDMRKFLVEIALSKAYQRAYEIPDLTSSTNEIRSQLRSAETEKANLDNQTAEAAKHYDAAMLQWADAESKLIPVALEVEKQRKQLATTISATVKLKSAATAAKTISDRDSSIQQLLKEAVASVNVAASKIGDKEIASLKQKAEAKLKKVADSAKANTKKATDAANKLKANLAKEASSKDGLTKTYAKRKPLRLAFDKKEAEVRRWRSELEKIVTQRGSLESKIATLEKIVKYNELKSQMGAPGDSDRADSGELQAQLNRIENSLVVRLSKNHTVSSLRPLTPEQLAWTMMKVTGFYRRYFLIEENKIRKELSLAKEVKLNLSQLRLAEERTHKILKGHLNNFIRYYAAGAGQPQGDFFATADQALFSTNSGTINSYVNPFAGNVTDRMLKSKTSRESAEELYLAVLSRMPEKDEVADVDAYLNSKKENKRQAVIELAWSLINSAEFRFNH